MALALADLPLLATPKQAAEVMGPTEAQVRSLVRAGQIACVMIGKRVMIPRNAIEQFIADNMVTPCRAETQGHVYTGTATVRAGTSPGPSEVAAGSAARALQIAHKLKSPSPNSSTRAPENPGRVIPLRSS